MATQTRVPNRSDTSDLEAQREYVRKAHASNFDFGIVVGEAFVRGIRDIGYKHTGTAIDELIDNAVQAGAQNVHVHFGYEGSSNKPARLAVIDDGHGMDPDMIRLSVIWGGTHREDDRSGFGRYGYGLPSASVSQGKRFTVYSTTQGGNWSAVTIDLDEMSRGKYAGPDGRIVVPEASPAELPDWVQQYVATQFKKAPTHGTVVVIEKLDRLRWKRQGELERHLLEHFGIVYRNLVRQTNIIVNGQRVDPTDPLFITPGFRLYELPDDPDKAEALEPISFEVRDVETGQSKGVVRVRFSYMPPTFGSTDKDRDRGKKNARLAVMKDHKGIVVCRNGRQIDVIESRCPWPELTTFINYDMYWGCEVDFPATLDEEFSVTTSKQQIVFTDRMWTLLREAGVPRTISGLRTRDRKAREDLKHQRDAKAEEKRASEQAMEEAQKFLRRGKSLTPERETQVRERVNEEVRRRADATGIDVVQIEHQLAVELAGRPYRVELTDAPGAPFFWVEQVGTQTKLFLNRAHRFYRDVYAAPDSTPRLRASLEVVLFVVGECELDSTDERQLFYQVERAEWSRRLDVVLNRLEGIHSPEEDALAAEAAAEDAETAAATD